MKVTSENIDDVIREGYEKGQRDFYWTAREWKCLVEWCINNGFRFKVERFMGSTHYIKDPKDEIKDTS